MGIPQFPKISDDADKAPMYELFYKYADVFTKLGKPVVQNIKHKNELLDPEKLVPHHKLQRINLIKL